MSDSKDDIIHDLLVTVQNLSECCTVLLARIGPEAPRTPQDAPDTSQGGTGEEEAQEGATEAHSVDSLPSTRYLYSPTQDSGRGRAKLYDCWMCRCVTMSPEVHSLWHYGLGHTNTHNLAWVPGSSYNIEVTITFNINGEPRATTKDYSNRGVGW